MPYFGNFVKFIFERDFLLKKRLFFCLNYVMIVFERDKQWKN